MNYRIENEGGRVKKRFVRVKKGKMLSIIIGCAAVLVSGFLLWPRGRLMLRDAILPGDAAVTDHALQGLVENHRSGQPMSVAVEVFCKETIHGAEP